MIFDHPIPKRTVIVRANITNREELTRDIEDNNRFITEVNK